MRRGRPRFRLAAALLLLAGGGFGAFAATSPHDRAQALIDEGAPRQAIELLAPWIRKHPKDAEARLLHSTALFLEGRNQEGRSELDRALELDPDLRQGWLNRGAYALAEGDYEGALSAFLEAERIDPGADDNALNIGVVRLLRGELGPATERFRRYLEVHSDSADAYYLVASNYAMTGFVQPALQALTYAIRLDEKSRRRARIDPNFSDVARDPRFQELLNTDSYRPQPGSLRTERTFDSAFTGHNSRILKAAIRALEALGEPFDLQVEVAEGWALIWAESYRVKIERMDLATTAVQLTAPPDSATQSGWRERTEVFSRALGIELIKTTRSGPPPPPG